ncbi:MAG: HAMP domain-containing histidine kinase, partial [Planctomycetes bacterium]|nr:HAMP domain-containing histidine kinase [Planctomycetota bacterium]
MRLRLRERLQVGVTSLLVAFVATAVTILGTLSDNYATEQIAKQVREGRESFRTQMRQIRAQLRSETGFLARTPMLLAAAGIEGVDQATFDDVFDEILRQFTEPDEGGDRPDRPRLLAVVDARGHVIAARGGAWRAGDDVHDRPGLAEVLAGATRDAVWRGHDGPCLVAAAPLAQRDELLGVLVVGEPIDGALAHNIGAIAGRDVILAADDRVLAEHWRDEAPAELDASALTHLRHDTVGAQGMEIAVTVDGKVRSGLAVQLHPDGGVAFLPHDLDAIEGLRGSARSWLLLTGAVLTLLGLGFATRTAGNLSGPLQALIRATDRMRTGDLGSRVDAVRMDLELGHLASSFNDMAETVQTLVRDVSDKAARAEAANRAKDGFLTSVSHELRTPLTGIQSTAELLQQFGEQASPEERAEFLGTILIEAERLGQRISDALEFASLVGGTTGWTLGRVDLLAACEQACRRLDGLAPLKNVDIQILCPPDAVLQGDRERITQAIYHLVHNAWKWTAADSAIEVAVQTV